MARAIRALAAAAAPLGSQSERTLTASHDGSAAQAPKKRRQIRSGFRPSAPIAAIARLPKRPRVGRLFGSLEGLGREARYPVSLCHCDDCGACLGFEENPPDALGTLA